MSFSKVPEKSDTLLPSTVPTSPPAAPKRRLSHAFYVLLAVVCAGIALNTIAPGCMRLGHRGEVDDMLAADLCPQPSPLVPSKNGALWKDLDAKYSSDAFEATAVEWLGGAVRVP